MSNSLGRGLSSLIPQKVKKVTTTSAGEAIVDLATEEEKGKIKEVPVDKIAVNPVQPRKNFNEREINELAESIKSHGIIQPLIVTPKNDQYELIAGERRLRAAKDIGMSKVPVIVRQASEQEKLELALIENIQREDLNAIEKALAFRKLIDEFSLDHEEVAKRVGLARPSVSNMLRYLNLPEEIQLALMQSRINEGQAKIIAGLDSEVKQTALFNKIIHNGLNIIESMEESRHMGGTKMAKIKINYADKDKEFAFREFFSSKVEIKRKKKGGQIIIDFFSDEELGEMVNKIKN